MVKLYLLLAVLFSVNGGLIAQQWISMEGSDGPGKGKHIVFVSGDEEYRSEEALPMLAGILSEKYGFTCTVLFSTDPSTGLVDPLNQNNIPGLHHLRTADLMVIFTRFRQLPDSQMKYVDEYLKKGKPVVGLRTATHAFAYKDKSTSPFAKYSYNSRIKDWEDGFGKKVLGETWVNHHGIHGKEGVRALLVGTEVNNKNPILNGVKEIWVPTDAYTTRKLGNNCNVLVYGLSTNGMTADAPVNLEKSIMPVVWTKSYTGQNGQTGRVFTTTMGASIDLINEDLRRLVVNACFWAVGLEKQIPAKADVNYVSDYEPTMFGFDSFQKGKYPKDFGAK